MRPLRPATHAGPAAEADPGLAVAGPVCPRGHLNHAGNRYCHACGVAVAAGPVQVGTRPVVGALVRADGVRVPLLDEVALSACPPLGSAIVTARIVFLGWDPHALAETPGVRWAGPGGLPMPLEPGDSVSLHAGTQLVIGLDAYCYEPLDHTVSGRIPARHASKGRRRRRRLPDRSLFRP
jgi:hypothetical protein